MFMFWLINWLIDSYAFNSNKIMQPFGELPVIQDGDFILYGKYFFKSLDLDLSWLLR